MPNPYDDRQEIDAIQGKKELLPEPYEPIRRERSSAFDAVERDFLAIPLKTLLSTTANHIKKLENLNLKTLRDLLLYFPRTYNDTSTYTKITDIRVGEINTLKGQLQSLFQTNSRTGTKIIRGIFKDESGAVEAIWFNQPHLLKLLPRNKDLILTGKAAISMGRLSLQSPRHELTAKNKEQLHTGIIAPIYHETDGLSSHWFREKIAPLLKTFAPQFEEYLPEAILQEHQLIPYQEAILNIHFPKDSETLKLARARLAFDELFLLQLKALQKKWQWQQIQTNEAKIIEPQNAQVRQLIKSLPFELTNAQIRTLKEITSDLQKPYPMSRLIQGDVGSGKTIVAAIAALHMATHGYQTAVMAPTEILAQQHHKTFQKLLPNLEIALLTGSTPKSDREQTLENLRLGKIQIIIGTHALIQDSVSFHNLGLAIIDEQHRFGVKQRSTLKAHGTPHLLSMTATPIPRTLAITIYGDQDLSLIDEMPAGRKEILTRLVPEKKRQDAYRWIQDQIHKGRQAFVICPLIEESETLEVKSVTAEYEKLHQIFPDLKIGLLHGKLKKEEKDQIMNDFAANKIHLLVSTSVIEVGIDVPNASIMLIEGAERFGLAQLHQFRGRVGRGEHKSYCFLFPSTKEAEKSTRLKAMEKHHSGFTLSEIDLELRGPGEVFGLKQSGIPDLKMASLSDSELVHKARTAATKLIDQDPKLENHPDLQAKIAVGEWEIYTED